MKIAQVSLALLIGLKLGLPLKAAESPVRISLEVNHPGAAIAPDFSGLSYEVSLLQPGENGLRYFRPDNLQLVQLFRTLGIKSLRIGGNTSDRDAGVIPGEADLDSLFLFAKAADVKVIYGLRLHNGDPQAAAATVSYIMASYAGQVECFSIGQEASAYPVKKKDTRDNSERMGAAHEKFKYEAFAPEWKRFADAIHAAVPAVKLCGPGVHNNGGWTKKFMADFGKGNNVTLITSHLYPGGAGGKVPTPEVGRDRMLSGASAKGDSFPSAYQKLHDSFVPQAVANGLPYRLEEVNNYFNGGAINVSDTFASALWGLDFMYWWAEHHAAGVNFHTGDKVAAGSQLVPSKYTAFVTATDGYLVRPLGYGIKAFDLGCHGKFLPVKISSADHLNLTAYAVLGDDHNLYLTLINKEHGEGARGAAITLDRNLTHAQVVFLKAPDNNIAATTGQTLGGAEIKSDGKWSGGWTPLNASTLTLSPATAVIIKLPVD